MNTKQMSALKIRARKASGTLSAMGEMILTYDLECLSLEDLEKLAVYFASGKAPVRSIALEIVTKAKREVQTN